MGFFIVSVLVSTLNPFPFDLSVHLNCGARRRSYRVSLGVCLFVCVCEFVGGCVCGGRACLVAILFYLHNGVSQAACLVTKKLVSNQLTNLPVIFIHQSIHGVQYKLGKIVNVRCNGSDKQ